MKVKAHHKPGMFIADPPIANFNWLTAGGEIWEQYKRYREAVNAKGTSANTKKTMS